MKIKYSCVLDQHPRFGRQAFVWALSLLTYGGAETDSLVIHTVGEYCGEFRKIFDDWGIETRTVTEFDSRHPNSNKLAQLESEALQSVDYAVLCDCDISFCSDIDPWIGGSSIRARIASYNGLPWDRWVSLFKAADLTIPVNSVNALLSGEVTLPTYCNGGLYILPAAMLNALKEVWPRRNRWLLDRDSLLKPFGAYADQISFAMSCAELGTSIDHLPLELNYDGVARPGTLQRVIHQSEIHPVVLHYHRMSDKGLLRLTEIPSVNRQIQKINDLIKLAEQVNYDKSSVMLLRQRRSI